MLLDILVAILFSVLCFLVLGALVGAVGMWTPLGRDLRRKLFVRLNAALVPTYEPHVYKRKERLLGELGGTVLEIGPGLGVNFDYLSKDLRWIGVEPNPHMRARLSARANELGIDAEFAELDGERIDVEDASVSAVVSTLVLCSVPDPARVLAEIRRVLEPGGRFVFLEHVAATAGTWTRRMQACMKPFQIFFGDGCRPDRDLASAIRSAGFERVELEEFLVPKEAVPSWVRPHIAGVALR